MALELGWATATLFANRSISRSACSELGEAAVADGPFGFWAQHDRRSPCFDVAARTEPLRGEGEIHSCHLLFTVR